MKQISSSFRLFSFMTKMLLKVPGIFSKTKLTSQTLGVSLDLASVRVCQRSRCHFSWKA